MHHGEGMGGDCALSHRVSCASWVCMLTINQTVSPCFCMLVAHDVYWCALQYVYGISKLLTMKCSSIFGKWCQGFCPSAVQLQHSPSLCPCHTGVISYSVVFMSLQICHLKSVLLNLISYCKPTTMCECHKIIEGSWELQCAKGGVGLTDGVSYQALHISRVHWVSYPWVAGKGKGEAEEKKTESSFWVITYTEDFWSIFQI